MKGIWKLAMMAAAATLAGCGGSDDADGALSAEESQELNNAAEMLDASPDSLIAADEAPLGNGEEPVLDNATDNSAY